MNILIRRFIAVLLLHLALPLAAQVPQIINYQGKVAVGTTPFTGTGQFRFALVNGTGSTSYWSNDGTSTAGSQPTAAVSLPVVNGLYVVPMGDATLPNMTGIPASVFSNADVRVRVWFNDGTNGSQLLSPDQRITSVGYAMVAGSVPDGTITTAKLAAAARPKFDRQVLANHPGNVTLPVSPTFIDLPRVTLTSKDLGETGTYVINFRAFVYYPTPFTPIFSISINGNRIAASEVYGSRIYSSGGNPASTTSLHYIVTGVATGSVIKVQVSNDSGSSVSTQIFSSQLTIDGVPSSHVVP